GCARRTIPYLAHPSRPFGRTVAPRCAAAPKGWPCEVRPGIAPMRCAGPGPDRHAARVLARPSPGRTPTPSTAPPFFLPGRCAPCSRAASKEDSSRVKKMRTSHGTSLRERLHASLLYLCTDARTEQGDLAEFAGAALAGGVDIIQLRDRGLDTLE